ncbi:MAG: hypothetical protein SFV32_04365 [Opitutaceae bacterium]|nr:hypothetical protein [Opitutaceae bacterium]
MTKKCAGAEQQRRKSNRRLSRRVQPSSGVNPASRRRGTPTSPDCSTSATTSPRRAWPASSSPKTEGQLAKTHAIHHPILFLLRHDGAVEKGWRDTPFYWSVVRAQANTPTAIYAAETID